MKFFQSICLAASVLLASTADAAPVTGGSIRRQNVGAGKRIALWEWTLTHDLGVYPGIKATADALGGSREVRAVVNWESWRPSEVPLPFLPMARTLGALSDQKAWGEIVDALAAQRQAGVAQPTAFFLNEPERQNVSPAEAAARWRDTFLPLRAQYGARLVGPAPASDAAGSEWQRQFMGALSDGERPDLLAVHFYTSADAPSSSEVPAAQAYIRGQHDAYGLPVVVSEIASTSRDAGQVDAFTRAMAQWLDAQDWVHQYGFFGMSREPADAFVSPAAQLLDGNGYLTPLGRFYAGLE